MSKDVTNISPIELIEHIDEEISLIENDIQKGISYIHLGIDRQSSFESMVRRLDRIETLCKQIDDEFSLEIILIKMEELKKNIDSKLEQI